MMSTVDPSHSSSTVDTRHSYTPWQRLEKLCILFEGTLLRIVRKPQQSVFTEMHYGYDMY